LHAYDEMFPELFKIRADFDSSMDWSDEHTQACIGFMAAFCRKEALRPLDAGAAARRLEHSARVAEDQTKLTTLFGILADVIRETNYWAAQAGASVIDATHIGKALEQKVYRASLIQERIRELIAEGTLLIDIAGERIGQVNGLAVLSLSDYAFGKPSRITASVGPGREGIVDIEREIKLGGPLHSKGVMILGGYLADRYAQDKPLTLQARLVFEQSYEGVEGDSASGAELYALLSALAGLPIKQGIAGTGSVNQHGDVQAIGGVNEKIEGFFDICRAHGLTGDQGVLIPHSNARHLMLREDVVAAVRAGQFHIWAARTIDEGIEILTGTPAGTRDFEGQYPEDSANGRVDRRLREFMGYLRAAAEPEAALSAS
jgi:predicted ATP-dependent protease